MRVLFLVPLIPLVSGSFAMADGREADHCGRGSARCEAERLRGKGVPAEPTTTPGLPLSEAPVSDEAAFPGPGLPLSDTAAPAPAATAPASGETPALVLAGDLPDAERADWLVLVFDANAARCQWIHRQAHLDLTSRACRPGDDGYDLAGQGGQALTCHAEWNMARAYRGRTGGEFIAEFPQCARFLEHLNDADPHHADYAIADRDGDGTLCFEAAIGCAFLVGPPSSVDPSAPPDGTYALVQVLDSGAFGPPACTWVRANQATGWHPCRQGDPGWVDPAAHDFTGLCLHNRDWFTFLGPWLGAPEKPLDFRFFLRDNPQCRPGLIDYSRSHG